MDDNERFINELNKRSALAYYKLYDDYYKALVAYSTNFVSAIESAEDIVQDLFIGIWEKNLTFFSYSSLKHYLYNSVRNASINYLKHQNVEALYIQKLIDTYKGFDDEDDVYEEEVYRLLFKAIDKLPSRCKEVFLLYMDGKKNEEIADMLNIAVETVKTQKKRAIQSLKKQLGSLFFVIPFPIF
jgi:RNA polymerase sigma-70 factor (family 1)